MRCSLLHRWFFALSVTALLYGGAPAFASEAGGAATAPAPGLPQPAGRSLEPAVAHIALLMPANSSALARAADAVKSGFAAAAKLGGGPSLPLRVYELADHSDSAVLEYRRAVANGAHLVVGPLTRDGVTALASSGRVTVPTVALNVPEGSYPLPPNFYVLSLHVEAEAAQVARLAIDEGRLRAVTITGETPLLRRIQQGFVEAYAKLGGRVVAEYAYTGDPGALATLRKALRSDAPDMVFFALDFGQARLVRPYAGAFAIYATSQVHPGHGLPLAGFDLAGVRFLDMPWLLQPDHPAVMVYPRPAFSLDHERLYALGIDAYRVGAAVMKGERNVTLDGVTGQLRLGPDQRFIRALTAAHFADGKLLIFAGGQ